MLGIADGVGVTGLTIGGIAKSLGVPSDFECSCSAG
jgi:hypothetical protein